MMIISASSIPHDLAPAKLDETVVAEDMLQTVQGWVLGDRYCWDPPLRAALAEKGLHLLAPYKSKKHEPFHYPHWLTQKRYRIQKVIGQLVERIHAKKVWDRDIWHLTFRRMRKLLSHSIPILF